MSQCVEYPYKPKPGRLLLGIFLFGGLGIYLANVALKHNSRVGIHGASIFFWMETIACFGVAALGALALFSAIMNGDNSSIRLTRTELYIPRGFLKKESHPIQFQEITRVTIRQMRTVRFLEIQCKSGKVTIHSSALPNDVVFEQVCKFVIANVRKDSLDQVAQNQDDANSQ